MTSIVSGTEFNVEQDYVYTKAKVNARGGTQVGILNSKTNKSLYVSTPLMLTWGINTYTDEKTGEIQNYDMALQFPNDEYNNPQSAAFLKNMQELESKLKRDAITNSKEWLKKSKLSSDAVDALWSPMLKYPKDKETGEFDYSRSPTLKLKIPYWDGEIKNLELYNDSKELVYPSDDGNAKLEDFVVKGSNVATIIQCGGIWVANGKIGVTWRLFQAVVKPRATLAGKCHISLTDEDKQKLNASGPGSDGGDSDSGVKPSATAVDDSDSDSDDDVVEEVTKAVAKSVKVEDAPKKKRVVKKKTSD